MSDHVIVWDLKTVPDIAGYAAAKGLDGKSDDEVLQRSNPRLTLIRMSFVPRHIPYTCTAREPAPELLRRDLARRTFGICSLYESCPA
jgi:hypothetical protein